MSESVEPAKPERRLSKGQEDLREKSYVNNFNTNFKTKVNLASVGSDEPIFKSVQIDFPAQIEATQGNNEPEHRPRVGRPSIVDEFIIKNLKIDSKNPVKMRLI